MRRKVLWIEDGATFEALNFTGPVYNSRRYDLVIALSMTDAEHELINSDFDIVIVDIRMEPGESTEWIKLYESSIDHKLHSRLGLVLLLGLFRPGIASLNLPRIPSWIEPKKFGVLTVELWEELEEYLSLVAIPKEHYRQKKADTPVECLLELVDTVARDCYGDVIPDKGV